MTNLVQRIMVKTIIGYIKVNWGAPFILLFILLFFGSAIQDSIAISYNGSLAVIALLVLIFGVLLQTVSFLKYGRTACEENL